MFLVDQWRQWLQNRGYWNLDSASPAGPRSEDEEQPAASSTGDDDSTQRPNRCIDEGEAGANLSWGAGAFSLCALTCDDVRQGIAKGMKARPWQGTPLHPWVVGAASLLLLLLLYQISRFLSSPDMEIREALQGTAHVNSPTFNCSDLELKGDKTVVESQHYHVFPSDRLQSVCRSQFEQHCFRKNTQGEFFPPPKFLALLRRYEEYHARCTKDVDLTDLAMAGGAPPGCKYLVWKAMDGMGNQLLSLVCAFVYSLLTDRVLLIDTASHIDSFLCNPFPSSSWALPAGFPETRLRWEAPRVFTYLDETLAILQRNSSCNTIPPADLPSFIAAAPKHLHAFITCCDSRRDHQFFCPTAQKLFSGANWFFYRSHEYTLPGLFFVPEFRDKLNDWFPRRDVFMHASRYLLSPENSMWERITQFYRAHMDGADKLVGIQPRSWKGDYSPAISEQIARCVVEQELLPATTQKGKKARTDAGSDGNGRHADISVLVTSLRAEYGENLALRYANHPNADNLAVDVITPSSEGWQKTGDREHDAKAVIDIWLLSFMHDLVTTPLSTFGSTASGFAGIVPLLFRNYGNDNLREPACERTNAGGPCFIVYPRDQPCDLDPARASIFNPDQKVPEVKLCTFNPGLGIVTQ